MEQDSQVKKAMKKTDRATGKKKWAQAAVSRMEEKGTVGSLTRIAKSHGKTAMQFAHEHIHDSGAVGKKARFAVNINK
jgi:hypothetical protein